jgi:hypothetical protein
LNGIFHAQRIPHEHQLVEKTEDVQGQEGGDGPGGCVATAVGDTFEVNLEMRKDITGNLVRIECSDNMPSVESSPLKCKNDHGLDQGDDGKCPRPF